VDGRARNRDGCSAFDHLCSGRGAHHLVNERGACARQQSAASSRTGNFHGEREKLIDAVRDALYASKIISYAQGFVQLGSAANLYTWKLNFGDIATIWRGAASFAPTFSIASRSVPAQARFENLLLDPFFRDNIEHTRKLALRHLDRDRALASLFSVSARRSSYYDSYRQERLPTNLLQAQRDFFRRAYFRTCRQAAGEFFHHDWLS
jgi:6-phosphogluconate dehydrogenase